MDSLSSNVFRAHIGPRLGARNLAQLQLVSSAAKSLAGNALRHTRFDNDKAAHKAWLAAMPSVVARVQQAIKVLEALSKVMGTPAQYGAQIELLAQQGWTPFAFAGGRARALLVQVPFLPGVPVNVELRPTWDYWGGQTPTLGRTTLHVHIRLPHPEVGATMQLYTAGGTWFLKRSDDSVWQPIPPNTVPRYQRFVYNAIKKATKAAGIVQLNESGVGRLR